MLQFHVVARKKIMSFTSRVSLFLLLFGNWCLTSEATFDIDEINSIYYGMDIMGTPILKDKFNDDVLMMVNRQGQEYACTLPIIPLDLKSSGSKDETAAQVDTVDISELLKPMEEAPCLLSKKDWWTYEFCYGQVIKQYHMEGGKIAGAVLILGRFESEYDWSAGGKGGADVASGRNSNRLQRFHSQYYTNGTKCDLTNEPRRSEVRFKCETDVGDYIERVDEPESCRYIVTIATTRVCHHPYLRPHPSRTPHQISCAPVLEENKLKQYTQRQNRKKKEAEERAKAAALAGLQPVEESDINIKLFSLGSAFKDIKNPFSEAREGNAEASSPTPASSSMADAQDEVASGRTEGPSSLTGSAVLDNNQDPAQLEVLLDNNQEPVQLEVLLDNNQDPAQLEVLLDNNQDPAQLQVQPTEALGVGSVIEVAVNMEDEPDEQDESPLVKDDNNNKDDSDAQVETEDREAVENVDITSVDREAKLTKSETHLDRIIQRIGKHYSEMTDVNLGSSSNLNKLREQLSAGTDELQELLDETLSDLDEELSALSDLAEKRGDLAKLQLWRTLALKVKNMKNKTKQMTAARKKETEPEFGTDEWVQWRVKKNEKIISKAQETLNSVGDMNAIMDAKVVAEAEKIVKDAVAAKEEQGNEDDAKKDDTKDIFELLSNKMVDEFIKEYLSDHDAGSKDDESKLSKNSAKGKRGEGEEEASVVISSLQQSIKNKIKEAGIDVNKHKIEVQILTPGAEFGGMDNKLSAEQAASVETLVVKLMGAQKEEIMEREQHETLSDNYNFSFDDEAGDATSGEETDQGPSHDATDDVSTGQDIPAEPSGSPDAGR